MTTSEHTIETSPELGGTLKKYQNTAAFFGLVFLAALAAGYHFEGAAQFMRSYLAGFWYWFGAGAACLLILMAQYLTGGAWGLMIRRPLEAGAKTLKVMVFLFLPLLIFRHDLYWWTTPAGQADKIIQEKSLYLNETFWYVRTAIYALFFLTFVTLLTKWSREEDETKSMSVSARLEKLSAPGVLIFFLLMTWCSVDFLMTLEPHWTSTVYGFMIVIGWCLTAMSLIVATVVMLARFEPFNHALTPKHLHDLGKLLFALTMLWAYLNFSQLLITWSGNLPDEIVWYIKRWNGGYGWMSILLLLGHFALPFLMLISQGVKKNGKSIQAVAIYLLVIHAVDVFNLVQPNFTDVAHPHFSFSWLDIAAPLGFGGLWLALFFYNLPAAPLLPVGAPDLQKALNHGKHH